jgi:TonB family protein
MLCIRILVITFALTRGIASAQEGTADTPKPSPAAPQQSNPPAASEAPASPQNPLTDTKFLEPTKIVKAIYPVQAEKDQLQGEVVVKLTVTESGDVDNVEVISGNPILARAAVDAARKWKFKPVIRNGKAVKASTKIPFDFAYPDRVTDIKPKEPSTPDIHDQQPVKSNGTNTESSSPDTKPSESGTLLSTVLPQRVKVVQGVVQGMVVHRVAPVYPPEAKRARIQGTVVLAAIIGKDGKIKNLNVISGPSMLVDAAVGAVQQWRYRPYVLQGEPVEVDTTITVNFNLR